MHSEVEVRNDETDTVHLFIQSCTASCSMHITHEIAGLRLHTLVCTKREQPRRTNNLRNNILLRDDMGGSVFEAAALSIAVEAAVGGVHPRRLGAVGDRR